MQNKGIFHLAGKQNRITIELAVVNFGVEWSKGGSNRRYQAKFTCFTSPLKEISGSLFCRGPRWANRKGL
jgi:hypothetical protein